ncbi:MAG: hypothetical protein HN341_02845 [Verrucomicrobia bacterium]|jgi:predicted Fe-Mo cluster-binding NifX family protein|nr:hypothetical protein [Verrucomicrobiota bacterium]
MKTTLAIPMWEGQVSTTFDFARKLLVVEADGGREISRKEISLGDESVERKARIMRDLAVQVVVCGAISQPLAEAISQIGIQIIPYVTGPVERVLAGYLCGRLAEPQFLQPGCRPGARRRWRHQGGRCGNEANRGNEPQTTHRSQRRHEGGE